MQVVTITFNPTIDKSTSIDALFPEKKLRCAQPKFEPGGGGINVSRAIKKLGGDSLTIYPAGGHTGNFLNILLKEEGINTKVVETSSFTRENLIVLDKSLNHQYRFGMPGPMLQESEWKACLHELEALTNVSYIVASGSLPPGVPDDVFGRIAAIAKDKNARFIADTSGTALKKAVEEGVYLLKPNLTELTSLVNKEDVSIEEVEQYGMELIEHGKSSIVVVSLGSSGAMMITKNKSVQFVPPVVRRQSTVGAGDSMVAGIVHSLVNNKTVEEAVRYGVASGTAATLNPGTELCRLEDAERLYKCIKVVA
ncbi:MAG TPA: 1-phosphofructokinase family hexose kinase [Chitinophagaceae bacterium]|nr:1-phosphofructokinase family hexose kinase [Chitinophagaceae bacterium]